MAPATYYAWQIDTGAESVFSWGGDYTGVFTAGIAVMNSANGTPPYFINVFGATIGDPFNEGVLLAAGSSFTLAAGSNLVNCYTSACAGIRVASTC